MSEYGSRIISAGGKRQVDHKRLVPQLIAQIWAGNYQSYDSPAQNGWWHRQWVIDIPQVALGRPYLLFFSLPKDTREVYYYGAPAGAACIFQPGAVVDPPMLYYFALDYVTYGPDRYGRRVWDASGRLLYDSGNRHLNLDQTFTGLNQNMGYSNHEASMVLNGYGSPKGFIPTYPAISTDSCELHEEWGSKQEHGIARARMFYRFAGDQLQSIFCRYEYTIDGLTFPAPFTRINRSNGINNTVMVIDRWQHDV
jgi:hypothetical protein